MPMPPAADTAATSSGLEHGYIAPPTSGSSTPASRVSAVAREAAPARERTQPLPQSQESGAGGGGVGHAPPTPDASAGPRVHRVRAQLVGGDLLDLLVAVVDVVVEADAAVVVRPRGEVDDVDRDLLLQLHPLL